jgi:hypothetical protein
MEQGFSAHDRESNMHKGGMGGRGVAEKRLTGPATAGPARGWVGRGSPDYEGMETYPGPKADLFDFCVGRGSPDYEGMETRS